MGLYLLRCDKSLDRIIEGTPARIPKPKRYKIGRNCEAVSPAKLSLLTSNGIRIFFFYNEVIYEHSRLAQTIA
jgi:hypothetical protein